MHFSPQIPSLPSGAMFAFHQFSLEIRWCDLGFYEKRAAIWPTLWALAAEQIEITELYGGSELVSAHFKKCSSLA